MIDFASWPTFPCYLDCTTPGVWIEYMPHIDVYDYDEPNRGLLELIENKSMRSRGDDWLWDNKEILERMTERQREVVVLRMEGYTSAEIAEMVGKSQRAVLYRIQFAQSRTENLLK